MSPTITTIAGGREFYQLPQDGTPATEVYLNFPIDVSVKPDGSFYASDTPSAYAAPSRAIFYVDTNGIMTTVAGATDAGYVDCQVTETWAEGIPAREACVWAQSFAAGPDGNLYIAYSHGLIRRVGPEGTITTVAGTNPFYGGGSGFSGDGGPATEAQMGTSLQGITFGPDGSLYIADHGNYRVRRVGPDGIIDTVAGKGYPSCPDYCSCGDGGPATDASLSFLADVAVGPDGSLYIADYTSIRKVGPDGIISTLACGTASYAAYLPDRSYDEGIPATSALAGRIRGIDIAADGSLYFSACDEKFGGTDRYCFVRRIGIDGIINTVVGTGVTGYSGDGAPPLQAQISIAASPGGGIDIGPEGSLYIADTNNLRIRRVGKSFPGADIANMTIPSEDGTLIHNFDSSGRHLNTLHALTGAMLYQFNYDGNGFLVSVTDGSGNVTTIERDAEGNATAIVSPYGQRSVVGLDANGYFRSIRNPASETVEFSYTDDGLLTTMTTPRNHSYRFTYDALGRITAAEDPSSGSSTLGRTELENGHEVTLTSEMGRVTTYRFERLASGERRQVTLFPDGTQEETLRGIDDSSITTVTPYGETTTLIQGPDPRFGMLSPISKNITFTTPGGLSSVSTGERTVNMANPDDPLSLTSQNDVKTVNGRSYTAHYDAATRTSTTTTPVGRQGTAVIDNLGRIVQREISGIVPTRYAYDTQGRLSTIAQGTGAEERTTTFGYIPAAGVVSWKASPIPLGGWWLLRTIPAGRVTRKTLPDGQAILLGYDAHGNVTSVTPPGKPAHLFAYTPVDLRSEYTSPSDTGTARTESFYNPDRQLTLIRLPDGQELTYAYDTAGRLSFLNLPGGAGSYAYAYHPETENLQSISAPGGSQLSFAYDGSLLTQQAWTGPVSGNVSQTVNNDFRVISENVNGAVPIGFSYDNDGLLILAGGLSITRSSQNGLITGTQIENVTDSRTYNAFGEFQVYSSLLLGDESVLCSVCARQTGARDSKDRDRRCGDAHL